MVSPWSASIVLPFSKNQYCPIVIDVGARRPGDHQIAELLEESVAVVPGEEGLSVRAFLHALGSENRAGIVLAAVEAVGVGGDRPDSPAFDAQGKQKLGAAAAAAPFAFDRYRAFAARDQRGRPLGAPRSLGHLLANLACLAGNGVAENLRAETLPAEDFACCLERAQRGGDHLVLRLHRLR